MTMLPRFDRPFPMRNFAEACTFDGNDFYRRRAAAHLTASDALHQAHNDVDVEEVPVRHFGFMLLLSSRRQRANGPRDNKVCFATDDRLEFEAFANDATVFVR